MKYMVYELGFNASDGKPYYMAGRKEVKDAPMTDMWKATTTLYTQLHQGSDKTGPVIGAGVLTLGVTDLLAMIPTMHATNTTSPQQAAETVAKFGKFFLGEIWDTYVAKGRSVSMDFDVIVIGSGFGGAISACRLAEAGYKVLILERGRRWDKTNYPRTA